MKTGKKYKKASGLSCSIAGYKMGRKDISSGKVGTDGTRHCIACLIKMKDICNILESHSHKLTQIKLTRQ